MKVFFLVAMVGHIICGISDCLITYAPHGKILLTNFKDYEKSKVAFKDMPLKNLNLAMLLGFVALTMQTFGYLEVCNWIKQYSNTMYWTMYVSALVIFVSLTSHHMFCCLAEWFFVRLDRTKQSLDAVWEFFKTTAYTMYVGYVAILVYYITMLIAIASGVTELPKLACLLTPIPLALVIVPTKAPAKANIVCAITFLAMFILT